MENLVNPKLAYNQIYDSSYDDTVYDMGFIFLDEDEEEETSGEYEAEA